MRYRNLVTLSLLTPALVAANLELRVLDAGTGRALPARVLVRDKSGKAQVPAGAVKVPIGPDDWFVCNGRASVALTPGRVLVQVERGTEYTPVVMQTMVAEEQPAALRVALRRWIDMGKRGYRSGEDHIHVASTDLAAMLAAEDLDFGSSFHWWNGPKLPLPPQPKAVMDLEFGGHARAASLYDAEVENSWGAVYLIGLTEPMSIAHDRRRANLAYVKRAREQGALICYQGGWSRESLVDALLGYVDVININNNNFHRFKFQPRRIYSNLLQVPGFPEYPDTPDGMLWMNTDTYYRMLNCGLRLAAGAGSAVGAKTTPVGYNRSYVHTGGDASLKQFLESWRKGRNFVTNGPMVFLTADAGLTPGDEIPLPARGGRVRVKATAVWDQPLRSLEIVRNGAVVTKAGTAQGRTGAQVSATLDITEGAWIVARATALDNLLPDADMARYSKQERRSEAPSRLRFGHTSPIYITVGDKGARVEKSVQEARQMLDAFERFARKEAGDAHREEILAAVAEARRRLER
jgi:hypothetical protein